MRMTLKHVFPRSKTQYQTEELFDSENNGKSDSNEKLVLQLFGKLIYLQTKQFFQTAL